MAHIATAVGILFCIVILKMSLQVIDRRDFITELLYVTYIMLAFLVLLIVVPDMMRPQSSPETQLLVTMCAVFAAFIRWNAKSKVETPKTKEIGKAGARDV
jgi:hypothetical protein